MSSSPARGPRFWKLADAQTTRAALLVRSGTTRQKTFRNGDDAANRSRYSRLVGCVGRALDAPSSAGGFPRMSTKPSIVMAIMLSAAAAFAASPSSPPLKRSAGEANITIQGWMAPAGSFQGGCVDETCSGLQILD